MRVDQGDKRNSGTSENVGDHGCDLLEKLKFDCKINFFSDHKFRIPYSGICVAVVVPHDKIDACRGSGLFKARLNLDRELDMLRKICKAELQFLAQSTKPIMPSGLAKVVANHEGMENAKGTGMGYTCASNDLFKC